MVTRTNLADRPLCNARCWSDECTNAFLARRTAVGDQGLTTENTELFHDSSFLRSLCLLQ